jgi:hypothetical protein
MILTKLCTENQSVYHIDADHVITPRLQNSCISIVECYGPDEQIVLMSFHFSDSLDR